MPEWQLKPDEYFARISRSPHEFEQALRLPRVERVTKIIPLKELREVESVVHIPHDLLIHIVRNIRTLDGQLPFKSARIAMRHIDPSSLSVGQRFCYRENYVSLLEEVPHLLNGLLTMNGGIADFGPHFIFGKDITRSYAMACYLPPLVELHEGRPVIMDGIHRNWISKQTGGISPFEIIISDISVPFPCGIHPWEDLRVISLTEKPKDIHERYFDLTKSLFRDLKYLGIDG